MKIAASDFHFAPFRREKFLTQKKSLGELIIQFFAIWLRGKERRVINQMAHVVQEKQVDVVIVNGDFMESTATEQGMRQEKDLKTALILKLQFERLFGVPIILNAGNHETGYGDLPLCTDPKAGTSLKSLENFLKLTDRADLYHAFNNHGYRIILIPYLFTEKTAVDFNLDDLKDDFLKKFESDLKEYEHVVLFIHDPDSLENLKLYEIIKSHREKIKYILCGHYHSPVMLYLVRGLISVFNSPFLTPVRLFANFVIWLLFGRNRIIVRKISEYFRRRRNIPSIIHELGIIIIPAPTGFFGMGGGFVVVDLERGTIEKY